LTAQCKVALPFHMKWIGFKSVSDVSAAMNCNFMVISRSVDILAASRCDIIYLRIMICCPHEYSHRIFPPGRGFSFYIHVFDDSDCSGVAYSSQLEVSFFQFPIVVQKRRQWISTWMKQLYQYEKHHHITRNIHHAVSTT
jgi:hypothetical protein